MTRILFLISLMLCNGLVAQGPYAPPAGQEDSDAIHKDSELFVAWAIGIEVVRGFINAEDTIFTINESNRASFGEPEDALGQASGVTTSVVSLGDGGSATLTFSQPIMNGEGPDFAIFENAVTPDFLELAHVEVSSNGEDFVRFPSHSLTPVTQQTGAFGSTDATNIHNLAGKHIVGYGTPFDLEELKDHPNLDVNNVTHVRIIDVVGSIGELGTEDSFGNKINDPFPTPFESSGFDLDAVGVVHQKPLNTKNELLAEIKVFPNPSAGILNIRGVKEPMQMEVVNSLGGIIHQTELSSDVTFNFDFPKGIYILVFTSDASRTIVKWMKE